MKKHASARNDLQRIPGVGPRTSECLEQLGYHQVSDLAGEDPQKMYERLCDQEPGETVDRCVLYVFRCATYFAGTTAHDADLLKWWNWKDPIVASKHA